jgi:hypothetical protein
MTQELSYEFRTKAIEEVIKTANNERGKIVEAADKLTEEMRAKEEKLVADCERMSKSFNGELLNIESRAHNIYERLSSKTTKFFTELLGVSFFGKLVLYLGSLAVLGHLVWRIAIWWMAKSN